jgi:hypothetical protein
MRFFCGRFQWLAVLALSFIGGRATAGSQPPNILLIFSDEHANQAVGAYGYGLNKTPNVGRIAAAGIRLDRRLTTRRKG